MANLIYVAGPLFSDHERMFLLQIADRIAKEVQLDVGSDVFLPHRDAGDVGVVNSRNKVFSEDISHLDQCEIVVALLDGADVDSGTALELGYAYAKDKKIFGLLTDRRAYGYDEQKPSNVNNMIWGVLEEGKTIFRNLDDLAVALKNFVENRGVHIE